MHLARDVFLFIVHGGSEVPEHFLDGSEEDRVGAHLPRESSHVWHFGLNEVVLAFVCRLKPDDVSVGRDFWNGHSCPLFGVFERFYA